MKTKFLLSLALTLSLFASMAQLKLENGNLTIGGVPPQPTYLTTIFGSTYFRNLSGNNFFQVDIWPAATRLASHYDQVVFYNTQTSVFNSIQVANVYNYSDVLAKSNIQKLNYGLKTIKQLRPVSYNFIKKNESAKGTQLGLIAQEVEKIMPELVVTDPEGRKLLNYTGIIPVLINAIQELQIEVESLKKGVSQ